MAQAGYKIVAHNGGWGVLHDGGYFRRVREQGSCL